MAPRSDASALLAEWGRGNRDALDRLLPLVYGELRRMAVRQLRRERTAHTLQPTALVHELYLRLIDQRRVDWRGRAHFLGVAAHVMRRILVDYARRHRAEKRGNGVEPIPIDGLCEPVAPEALPMLALAEALHRLDAIDPGLSAIVDLRAFGGLTIDEAAHVLNVSPTTAKREWRTARAWLTRELGYEDLS